MRNLASRVLVKAQRIANLEKNVVQVIALRTFQFLAPLTANVVETNCVRMENVQVKKDGLLAKHEQF